MRGFLARKKLRDRVLRMAPGPERAKAVDELWATSHPPARLNSLSSSTSSASLLSDGISSLTTGCDSSLNRSMSPSSLAKSQRPKSSSLKKVLSAFETLPSDTRKDPSFYFAPMCPSVNSPRQSPSRRVALEKLKEAVCESPLAAANSFDPTPKIQAAAGQNRSSSPQYVATLKKSLSAYLMTSDQVKPPGFLSLTIYGGSQFMRSEDDQQ